jgi:predicted O-linked N-acetylglucosamine transferase (SPINDLY family)
MQCVDYYLADPLFLPPGDFDRFSSSIIESTSASIHFLTGGTTTGHAMWMGVHTLTLAGRLGS